jgi:hypothetical protein
VKMLERQRVHQAPVCKGCEQGVRQNLNDRFFDINDLSLFDVLHPSRVPKLTNLLSAILECNRSAVCLRSKGRTSREVVSAILRWSQPQLWPSVRFRGGKV